MTQQGGWRRFLRLALALVWLGLLVAVWPFLLAAAAELGLDALGWPAMTVTVPEAGLTRTVLELRAAGARGNGPPVRVVLDHPWASVRNARVGVTAEAPDLAAVPLPPDWGVAVARGRLSFAGDGEWGAGGLTGRGRAELAGVAVQAGPVAVSGLSGRVPFTTLNPPVIPDGTLVTAQRVEAGAILSDAELAFGRRRNGRVPVERLEGVWAGGRLLTRPFVYNPAGPSATLVVEVVGVDVAAVLALAELEGLDGTGSLSGRVPVILAGERLRIDGGRLTADGPGLLRYKPAAAPLPVEGEAGASSALLLKALTDFRYETLEMGLSGEVGGELAARLAIHGANPAFYDGYPVALTLNLSGALDRVLRRGLETWRLPRTLRDRLHKEGP